MGSGSGRRRPAAVRRRAGRILFTHARASPEQTLLIRGAIVLALVGLVLLVFWLDRDGFADRDDDITLVDLIYFTMVTITTVGYGDIVPISPTARMIDAFLVTPIRTIIWFIFLGTAYEFVVQRIVEEFRMKRLQEELRGHVVVCGYGRSGRIAAREVVANGRSAERVVAIDIAEARVRLASDDGHVGLLGDAGSEDLVARAAVDRADAVIISTGRDDLTILIVLTVRNLAPQTRIVASIKEEENVKLARHAGADSIVSPPRLGGYLLADAVDARFKSDFLCDIMTAAGPLKLDERLVGEAEVGRTPMEIAPGTVVQVTRNGSAVSRAQWPRLRLQPGDVLLLVTEGSSPAAKAAGS